MASHRAGEVRSAAHTLASAARAAGFDPRSRPRPVPESEFTVDEFIDASTPRVFDFEAPERVARAA
jgi:hypothetical protein